MLRQRCLLAILVVAGTWLAPPVRAEPVSSPGETPAPPASAAADAASTPARNILGCLRDCIWPEPECQSPDGDWLCCYPPGVIGQIDYLNWAARRTNLDYAAVINPAQAPVPATGYTQLETLSLDFRRDEGLRAAVGYHFAAQWDLTWTYTQFHTEGQAALVPSNTMTLGLVATRSLLTGTTQASPLDQIEANGSLQLRMHDIEGNWRYWLNETVGFRAFGGVRLAMLDEQFNNTYNFLFQGFIPESGVIHQPVKMNAAGIRFGAELQWRTLGGLLVFGRAAQSILVADFQTQQYEQDTLSGLIINQSNSSFQIVPVLEAAVGVAWSRGPWEVSAGYEMSDWFNMVDPTRAAESLFLDGCFVRLALTR
jgi:hypothetical protein